jgi:hypothetical protein
VSCGNYRVNISLFAKVRSKGDLTFFQRFMWVALSFSCFCRLHAGEQGTEHDI